jgi:hypothetical protein
MPARFRLFVRAAACTIAVATAAGATLSRQEADAFRDKILLIAKQGEDEARAPRRTRVTEAELNSWLAYHARPLTPPGIGDPTITIVGQGKLGGRAVVDLDAVAKKKATGNVLDPWSYIGGKVPVTVSGVLHTKDGLARFELESAEVSGVPVPKTLLQELVSYYSRTPENPQGIRLDDTFQLPANIKAIEVGQSQAVVVQ